MEPTLRGKRIILGVSGSIAAYKAAFLIRLLRKASAEVLVITTESAAEFIGPITLATLSQREVLSNFIAVKESGVWNNHVHLGLWADLILVAPATSHTLSAFAAGTCANLLQGVYLSARCPIWVAPAMDLDMWQHPATRRNLEKLAADGVRIVEPAEGELASGLEGKGRMEEPEALFQLVLQHFAQNKPLAGKHVLVTSGPTYEPIDPVRFIGNRSSGKMGFALCEELIDLGASVHLVSGPVSMQPPQGLVSYHRVETAAQMLEAAQQLWPQMHAGILAAAVADYAPSHVADQKVKKSESHLHLDLQPTPDIAATLGTNKRPDQILAGFALETTDGLAHAEGKMKRKGFNFIVLNMLSDQNQVFGSSKNEVTILSEHTKPIHIGLSDKALVAREIVSVLKNLLEP